MDIGSCPWEISPFPTFTMAIHPGTAEGDDGKPHEDGSSMVFHPSMSSPRRRARGAAPMNHIEIQGLTPDRASMLDSRDWCHSGISDSHSCRVAFDQL